MEYNAWDGKNPPEHVAILIFTRMLSGPMDYTPGVLSLTGSDDSPIPSTIAKQLALYVVLYSPVVMAADTPENYARYPGPLQFIRDVPTDWSDRSEEHTSELQSLMRISYAVFCLKKKNKNKQQ